LKREKDENLISKPKPKSTAGTGTINLIALVTLGIHSVGEAFTSGQYVIILSVRK